MFHLLDHISPIYGHILILNEPNVVVKRLSLLLHIREVPGSNLSAEIGYLD
jgi:hypothetical protein